MSTYKKERKWKRFFEVRRAIVVLAILLLIDTFFDILRGTQGNPLFKPIENAFGVWAFPFLVPPVVALLYFLSIGIGKIVEKADKITNGKEIILTTLVVIFVIHDIWVFSLDYLGFRLIKSYLHMIPIYIIAGIAYSWWAEKSVKIIQSKSGLLKKNNNSKYATKLKR